MQRLSAALADRYVIERELGAGGMATVYLAHDVRHDRKVALKVLRPELSAILGGERFLHEIKTTANLQHPHILSLFDSGEADGLVYYVMPFVEGESLRDRLTREKQLPVEDAVRIAREVADALHYAHQHGIVHRDIKPENILLHGGHAMVADFGIALAASKSEGGTRMTETGMSLGTPHYMSPEQAMGEREITPKADIYALGCVLYEMLTAEPPFVGATAQAIIARVMTEEPRSLTMQRKTIPPHIEAAVECALQKLPADRFATAAEFAAALEGRIDASTHRRAVTSPSARPPVRLAALPWVIAALAIAAGAWSWLRPQPRPDVVRYALGLADSQALGQHSDWRTAISNDGRLIAYVGPVASSGRLWLRRRDALAGAPIPGTEGGFNPAFSPDGSKLAFIAGTPRALRVVSLIGGTVSVLTDSMVDRGGVSWGDDGYIYYDGHFEGDGIARIRETGGSPEIATMPRSDSGEAWHALPSALPGGKGLLFGIRRVGATQVFDVAVTDLRSGEHRVLLRGMSPRYAASGHLLYVTEEGALMAAPFDLGALRLTGEPVEVASGLSVRGLGRADVVVSTSGVLLYAAGATDRDQREFVWVTRNGGATPVDPAWRESFGNPSLSPDGRQVAVAVVQGTQADIWVKQLDRGPASRLTFGGRNYSPSWTRGGRWLTFVSTTGGGLPRMMEAPADGSAIPAPTRGDSGAINTSFVSRDGNWLVYQLRADIYAMRTQGDSTRLELLRTPANEIWPALSPDGRWLAYASDESGRFEVFVRPFPAIGIAKRQVSAGGGWSPKWSPDGRELFYVNDRFELVTVPVLPGASFAVGQPRSLFVAEGYGGGAQVTWYSPSPDGRRFLMTRGTAGAHSDVLVVVENFFEVLSVKAPR